MLGDGKVLGGRSPLLEEGIGAMVQDKRRRRAPKEDSKRRRAPTKATLTPAPTPAPKNMVLDDEYLCGAPAMHIGTNARARARSGQMNMIGACLTMGVWCGAGSSASHVA